MELKKGIVFTGLYFTGKIEVLEVLEDNNILKVRLSKDNSQGWKEDWNLAHTREGLKNCSYFPIKKTIYVAGNGLPHQTGIFKH